MVSDGDLDFEGVGDGVLDEVGLDVDLFNQMKNLNINESDVEDEKQDTEKQIKSRKLSESNPVFSLDRPSAKVCVLGLMIWSGICILKFQLKIRLHFLSFFRFVRSWIFLRRNFWTLMIRLSLCPNGLQCWTL